MRTKGRRRKARFSDARRTRLRTRRSLTELQPKGDKSYHVMYANILERAISIVRYGSVSFQVKIPSISVVNLMELKKRHSRESNRWMWVRIYRSTISCTNTMVTTTVSSQGIFATKWWSFRSWISILSKVIYGWPCTARKRVVTTQRLIMMATCCHMHNCCSLIWNQVTIFHGTH